MPKKIIIPRKLLVISPTLRSLENHNSLLGRSNKPTIVNELKLDENSLTNPKDIAEGFNDYSSNIGPNLASQIDTSNSNFETYVKNAESEFTAFQPVTVNLATNF